MKAWVVFLGISMAGSLGLLAGEFHTAEGIVVNRGMADSGKAVILRTPPGRTETGYRWTPPLEPVPLGYLKELTKRTRPLAISGDGSTVVGWSTSIYGDSEAFVWQDGTITGLGDAPSGRFESKATGCNHDGSFIIGDGIVWQNSMQTPMAMAWRSDGTLYEIGFLEGGEDRSYAMDCASTKDFVIGSGFTKAGLDSWTWTPLGGMKLLSDSVITVPGLDRENAPIACSADGNRVVGFGYGPEKGYTYGPTLLWRWSKFTGYEILTEAPGGDFNEGSPAIFGSTPLVSEDMSTIVVHYGGGSSSGILRWHQERGIDELEITGKSVSIYDISGNGDVVTGMMIDQKDVAHAVLWGPDGRIKILKEFLEAARTDTGDHQLLNAAAVSADGRKIAGMLHVEDPQYPVSYHATLDGLWIFDEQIDEFWNYSDWYGYYSEMGDRYLWHSEHGWQYCTGDELSAYIFDYGLDCWYWTTADLYPYFYKFGYLEGWVYYYVGCEPTERWFYLFDTGVDLQEEEMKTPSG